MQMPATTAIVIYAPHPLLLLDQCKGDGAGSLVEIEAQKEILTHVSMAISDRAFCLQGNPLKEPRVGQCTQELLGKCSHIHRACRAS